MWFEKHHIFNYILSIHGQNPYSPILDKLAALILCRGERHHSFHLTPSSNNNPTIILVLLLFQHR